MIQYKEFAQEAKKKKACKDVYNQLSKMTDLESILQLYFEHLDWTLENDAPSLKLSEKYKEEMEQYGLHVDGDLTLDVTAQARKAFLGKSNVSINASGYSVSQLVVRHDSKIKIKATGNAYIELNILDNAKADITAIDNAKVVVYRYGDKANYTITGAVKVVESNFEKK